jgi:hypothetical protein
LCRQPSHLFFLEWFKSGLLHQSYDFGFRQIMRNRQLANGKTYGCRPNTRHCGKPSLKLSRAISAIHPGNSIYLLAQMFLAGGLFHRVLILIY